MGAEGFSLAGKAVGVDFRLRKSEKEVHSLGLGRQGTILSADFPFRVRATGGKGAVICRTRVGMSRCPVRATF